MVKKTTSESTQFEDDNADACCSTPGRLASLFFIGAAAAVASLILTRIRGEVTSRTTEDRAQAAPNSTPSAGPASRSRANADGPAEAAAAPAATPAATGKPAAPPEPKAAPAPSKKPSPAPVPPLSQAASQGEPTIQAVTTFHVQPEDGDWVVKSESQSSAPEIFPTKKDALAAGRAVARAHEPSRLVIHRKDGTVSGDHSYGELT